MGIFLITFVFFLAFVTALSLGIIIRKKAFPTCATARLAGDHGEIGCGSCSVIDKEENCNKFPSMDKTN